MVHSLVGLAHQVPQGAASRRERRDVPHHGQPDLVVDELLQDLTGQAAAELEELRCEPRDRDHRPRGPQIHRGADDVQSVLLDTDQRTLRRADEDGYGAHLFELVGYHPVGNREVLRHGFFLFS
ncbi:hypothetical protein BBK14_05950 [Parafrankia soli]|uniref:Uncharacterized protein n=1 Tax=Parafrankia soli TaxID=2599596 RepID=A0A1S1PTY8_9ACTN|nr:hypothetical protein BBK14_05950 [Parafrankia soli]